MILTLRIPCWVLQQSKCLSLISGLTFANPELDKCLTYLYSMYVFLSFLPVELPC